MVEAMDDSYYLLQTADTSIIHLRDGPFPIRLRMANAVEQDRA